MVAIKRAMNLEKDNAMDHSNTCEQKAREPKAIAVCRISIIQQSTIS